MQPLQASHFAAKHANDTLTESRAFKRGRHHQLKRSNNRTKTNLLLCVSMTNQSTSRIDRVIIWTNL